MYTEKHGGHCKNGEGDASLRKRLRCYKKIGNSWLANVQKWWGEGKNVNVQYRYLKK